MPMQPWPHRVTFLAPHLRLSRTDEPVAILAGGFLATALFEHLCRHPVVAITDSDDIDLDDGDRLINAEHPRFAQVVEAELYGNRRDEVLWLELHLDPAAPPFGRLVTQRADKYMEQYVGQSPDGTLSGLVASCIGQWLAARNLPAPPRALEAFTASELLAAIQNASRLVAAVKTSPGVANVLLAAQKKLAVPFLRVCDAATDLVLDANVLKVEPDNPKALLRSLPASPRYADVANVIAHAPQWGKPHLAVAQSDAPPETMLLHLGIAATLMPRNVNAVDAYADALRRADRSEEAWRLSRRATILVPRYVPAHASALRALHECERYGEAYHQAEARRRALADLWAPGRMPPPIDGPMRQLMFTVAECQMAVGRLGEAVQLGGEALAGAKLPDAADKNETLRAWREDPESLCLSWAREAHFRAEPGRVLEGYGKMRVTAPADGARALAAMVLLGREEAATYAYAELQGTGAAASGSARVAGARAHALGGELGRAVDDIQAVSLACPQAKLETEIHRLLRLCAARPLQEWEAAIQERQALGALRVARLIARDAADFLPGADRSQVVRGALPGAPVAFQRAWLEPLKAGLGASLLASIDLFFHENAQPSLETADRLVASWDKLVAPQRPNDPTFAAQTLYVLAQALTRYLAGTTQPPSPLWGGYRQVAAEVLQSVSRAGVDWLDESLRPFLGAIEQASAGVDPWIVDTWLLRAERALDLDGSSGGHVVRLSAGLRAVSGYLRGDERIAFEHRMAHDLGAYPDAIQQVRDLHERGARALGAGDVATAWGDAAEKSLPPADALDVRWTAAYMGPDHGPTLVALGKALLGAGKGPAALEPLARGIRLLPPDRRGEALRSLAPVWRFDFPPDAAHASAAGQNAMRGGRFDAAIAPLRIAWAADPNPQSAKNLAIALARAGKPLETLAILGDARAAAQLFYESKRFDAATKALSAASHRFAGDDDWAQLGRVARLAGEDETAADAFGRAYHLRNGQLAPADLAGYASALAAIGDAARCEEAVERLRVAAANDPVQSAAGLHALARARLANGRFPEAAQLAQQAAAMCSIPEVRKEYNDTAALAARGQKPPQKPLRAADPKHQALAALAAGDPARARALAQQGGFGPLRASVTAALFRSDQEAGMPVSMAARAAVDTTLQYTMGQVDRDAAMARILALKVREDASYPADPPPPLPRRAPPGELDAYLAHRRR
jgi:tetratricopeptide (TPR) repeat protein